MIVQIILLQGLLFLQVVNSTFQFNIVNRLAKDVVNCCNQIMDKNDEQNRP